MKVSNFLPRTITVNKTVKHELYPLHPHKPTKPVQQAAAVMVEHRMEVSPFKYLQEDFLREMTVDSMCRVFFVWAATRQQISLIRQTLL